MARLKLMYRVSEIGESEQTVRIASKKAKS